MHNGQVPGNGTYNIPPRKLNGGLYTGEPFAPGAPWANVPVIPDAGYMTYVNLRSANPPAAALTQYPGGQRPGNNTQVMPGVEVCSQRYGLVCNRPPDDWTSKNNKRFMGHYYL